MLALIDKLTEEQLEEIKVNNPDLFESMKEYIDAVAAIAQIRHNETIEGETK